MFKIIKRIMDWFGTEASCPICGTMIFQRCEEDNNLKKCAYCGSIYINDKKLTRRGTWRGL